MKKATRKDIDFREVNDAMLKLISEFHGIDIDYGDTVVLVDMGEYSRRNGKATSYTFSTDRYGYPLYTNNRNYDFINLCMWLSDSYQAYKPVVKDVIHWKKVPKDTVVKYGKKHMHYCGLSTTTEGEFIRLYNEGKSSLTADSDKDWFRVGYDEVELPPAYEGAFLGQYQRLVKIGAVEKVLCLEKGIYVTEEEGE